MLYGEPNEAGGSVVCVTVSPAAEDRLADAGWMVARVRHDEDWDAVVRRYPSIFGTRRGGTSSA